MEQLLSQTKEKMTKALSHLEEELRGIRSGRATPALLEGIKVNVYGSMMALRDVASINSPEPRLLVVQPWDPNNSDPIAKAIRESGLGFNPAVDSNTVRVPVPPLTEERRGELSKLVNEKAETGRVAVRAVRREAMESVDRDKKSARISEDEAKRAETDIQKVTDELMKTLEEKVKAKQAELAQI
jgi:ribosome recycling factor